MNRPTRKQLVIQSLKSLHKAKMRVLFRLKSIRKRRGMLSEDETNLKNELAMIKRKMEWEIDNNSAALKDKS